MKIKINTLMLWIAVSLFTISFGFSLYFIGWKSIEQRIYLRGVNDAVNAIILQAQQNKEVVITTTGGQLILVPKRVNK